MDRSARGIGRRRLLVVAIIGSAMAISSLALGGGVPAAQAESASTAAEAEIQALADDVWAVLQRDDLDEADRHRLLVEAIEARTDVVLLGRLALGRHWRALDDAQRATYDALFRRVVVGSLARRLGRFAGDAQGSLEQRFQVMGSQPVGKQDILVRSTLEPLRGDPFTLDWRLRPRDQGPVVIDLAIEGVSLLVSQRSEFAAVIERTDMEGFLAELRARAETHS